MSPAPHRSRPSRHRRAAVAIVVATRKAGRRPSTEARAAHDTEHRPEPTDA
ncbi:hypothetical protein ACFYZ3_29390 [Streptomyces sp. NPDC001599]|uniref:hypothetical protein n=1 Tax=Streptomyces sp. NPDC001599 TaxID=3364591 RepID=UPI0036AF59A2